MVTLKQHSWDITHFIEQAHGCLNRKVDSQRLTPMPWLRGTCHICWNYKPITHIHRDSPIADIMRHQHCANHKKGKKDIQHVSYLNKIIKKP